MPFIKIPNLIFDFDLSPMDFLVYCGIKSFCNRSNTATVKAGTVADRCGIHRNSVYPSIKRLENLGLVQISKRTQREGYKASHRYTLADLPGKWFKVDYKLFSYNFTPSAFMVYAYIQSRANHANRAFPSYRQITDSLRISESTAIKAVSILNGLKLMKKKKYVRITRCYGHNNYTLLNVLRKIIGTIKKRVAEPFSGYATLLYLRETQCVTLSLYTKLPQINCKVKRFFLMRSRLICKLFGVP